VIITDHKPRSKDTRVTVRSENSDHALACVGVYFRGAKSFLGPHSVEQWTIVDRYRGKDYDDKDKDSNRPVSFLSSPRRSFHSRTPNFWRERLVG